MKDVLQAKEFSSRLEAGKRKGTDSPLEAVEGTQLCQHLALAPVDPLFWTSDLRTIR